MRRRTPEGAGGNDMLAYYATYLCVCVACNELCCRLRQATLDSTHGVLAPPLHRARTFLQSKTVRCDFLPYRGGLTGTPAGCTGPPGAPPVAFGTVGTEDRCLGRGRSGLRRPDIREAIGI